MFGAAVHPHAASSAFRTFTDLEGRKIEAELLEANKTDVRIRRDDGRVFDLQRSRLIQADQDYIDEWLRERAFAFGGIDISTWRIRKGSKRSEAKSTTNIEEDWCYKITITNNSRADLGNLSIEYRVYYREDAIRKTKESHSVLHDDGKASIGLLAARDEVQLETNAIVLDVEQLKIGWKHRGTGKRRVEDSLEGIRLRIFSNGELLKEYASPTNLPEKFSW